LITFCAAFLVRVICCRRRDRVDGHSRAIRGHVGDGGELIDGESLGRVLNKGRLGEENR
jgi:hypothetical protein